MELASGAQVSVINLYGQDEENRKLHSDVCEKHGHMKCDCLFCDLTYLIGLTD
ncbi:MAG: hypothetical protein Q4Q18_09775 [Methanobrevibacter sp.]|nr:hypothetical protein [Methanobrevibacter sp.]